MLANLQQRVDAAVSARAAEIFAAAIVRLNTPDKFEDHAVTVEYYRQKLRAYMYAKRSQYRLQKKDTYDDRCLAVNKFLTLEAQCAKNNVKHQLLALGFTQAEIKDINRTVKL